MTSTDFSLLMNDSKLSGVSDAASESSCPQSRCCGGVGDTVGDGGVAVGGGEGGGS